MSPLTLSSVNILRFADNTGALPSDGKAIDYFFGFGFGFDEEAKVVAIRAHILAFPKETVAESGAEGEVEKAELPPRDNLAAELEIECAFGLGDLGPFRNSDGEVKMPRLLLAHLMGITISTARGVFIGAGCSSLLQKAPIPVLQPRALVDGAVSAQDYPWVDEILAAPPEEE